MQNKISLKDYIKSDEYFNDALHWYYGQYVNFTPQIIFLWVTNIVFVIAVAALLFTVFNLFPYVIKINYAIKIKSPENKAVKVSHANYILGDARLSLASIFLENYVQKREGYNYLMLKAQANYVRNSSTRMAFNKFKNLYDIQNTESIPVKYQDHTVRNIRIIFCKYNDNNNATVRFRAIAKSRKHREPIEDNLWEADISFEMDNFRADLDNNSDFHFVVTDYKIRRLEEKNI